VLDKELMLGETAIDMPQRGNLLLYSSPTHRDMVPSCFFLFPERVKHNDVEIRDKDFANRLCVLQRDDEDKINDLITPRKTVCIVVRREMVCVDVAVCQN